MEIRIKKVCVSQLITGKLSGKKIRSMISLDEKAKKNGNSSYL